MTYATESNEPPPPFRLWVEYYYWCDLNYHVPAQEAYKLFTSYCDFKMYRIPGMDTVLRLAIRLAQGITIEEAAAAEYLYRWNLALKSTVAFGSPSTLGR